MDLHGDNYDTPKSGLTIFGDHFMSILHNKTTFLKEEFKPEISVNVSA